MGKRFKIVSLFTFFILLLFTLSGCANAGDKAFTQLEKAATQENGFNQQQEPLIQAEKDEQDLYQKIMALDTSKYDQIKKYSDQALTHVEERSKLMDKEKTSIDKAYDTFKEAIPYLNKVDNEEAKPHAKKIIDDMNKRHEAFGSLYVAYKKSIKLDKNLFTMLQDKNLTKDALTKQLTKVNDAYDKIEKQKDTFNDLTGSFNDEKKSFYKILKLGNP